MDILDDTYSTHLELLKRVRYRSTKSPNSAQRTKQYPYSPFYRVALMGFLSQAGLKAHQPIGGADNNPLSDLPFQHL